MGVSRTALPWVKLWESFAEILILIMPQSCGICGASHSQLQQFRPRVPAYGRKQGNGGTQGLRQISKQPRDFRAARNRNRRLFHFEGWLAADTERYFSFGIWRFRNDRNGCDVS